MLKDVGTEYFSNLDKPHCNRSVLSLSFSMCLPREVKSGFQRLSLMNVATQNTSFTDGWRYLFAREFWHTANTFNFLTEGVDCAQGIWNE